MNLAKVEQMEPVVTLCISNCLMCEESVPNAKTQLIPLSADVRVRYVLCDHCQLQLAITKRRSPTALMSELFARILPLIGHTRHQLGALVEIREADTGITEPELQSFKLSTQ